ncbi:MAG: PH domain-containing protein [Longicatena sp.]
MTFRGKTEWWYYILVFAILLCCIHAGNVAIDLMEWYYWGTFVFELFVLLLMLSVFVSNEYTFHDKYLELRFSIFSRQKVFYQHIQNCEKETRSFVLSSTAAVHPLRILYRDNKVIYVAPIDEVGFMQELQHRMHAVVA